MDDTQDAKKGFEWSLFRQLTTVTCVSVCIFPVTLLYFREVSVASPIANLLLVPICSLMLMLSLANLSDRRCRHHSKARLLLSETAV